MKIETLSLKRQTLFAAALAATTMAMTGCNDGQLSDSAAASAPKESATLGAAIDDTGITAKIKQRLASDDRLKGTDVGVETNNGVVTLSGTSTTAEGKSAAEELARTVAEVKGVDNKINSPSQVDEMASKAEHAAENAGAAVSDAAITTQIKAKLAADDTVKATSIKVQTNQGVVTLSGEVVSRDARERAVGLAKTIDGVKSVDDDELKVVRS